MLDIHSHILPGVDDGAADEKAALDMLKAARLAGIDKLVATPHIFRDRDIERCVPIYCRYKEIAEDNGIELVSGYELSVRVLVNHPVSHDRLSRYTIGNSNIILLELSFDAPPIDWEYLISDIIRLGYNIIIAHPERYPYIAKNIGFAQSLISYGCELQIDASSLRAKRFSSVRRAATNLLERGLISYIASDAHKSADFEMFSKVYHNFKKCWPDDGLLNSYL